MFPLEASPGSGCFPLNTKDNGITSWLLHTSSWLKPDRSPTFPDPPPLIPTIPAEWKATQTSLDGKCRVFGWSDGYWHGTAASSHCVKAPIHRPFSSKGVTSALRLKEEGKGGGGEGAHVYGLNSFKTPESLTNSRKPLEKDWARAEPRLGWLLLCELRDRESRIHFCLNEVSDPPWKWHIYHPGDLCTPRLRGASSIWRGQIWLQIYPRNLSPALHLQTVVSIKVDAVLLNLWRHRNARTRQNRAAPNIQIAAGVGDHSHQIIGIAFLRSNWQNNSKKVAWILPGVCEF